MEDGIIIVNEVPYDMGSEQEELQDLALDNLDYACKHNNFRFETAVLPEEWVPRWLIFNMRLRGIRLKRNAIHEIGGNRHLPFIKEILDRACCEIEREPDLWVGLLNSDVFVTERLFEAFNKDNDIVLSVVSDVNSFEELKTGPYTKRISPPDNPMCCDGVFMRSKIWKEHRKKIPDYVLGECYWDAGYLRHFGKMDRAVILDDRECLHVKHKGGWDTGNVDWTTKPPTGMTVTGEYNIKLYYGE